MNKSDTSDGSRGQLTIRTHTCHLLQIQFLWTWILETGQTHSFAAFRTYKEWVPVVLRVPSASTRIFLRVVDTDTYQQSASMCVYQATQDGSWGLTFMTYFSHGIQILSRWRNPRIICRSLVWLFQRTKYSSLFNLDRKNLPPDGSNDAFRILFAFLVHYKTSSGAHPALPMEVAPEAIVKKSFFEYSLKDNVPSFISWDHNVTS
jgi:hypothetical protein